jgi:hypothetical protein
MFYFQMHSTFQSSPFQCVPPPPPLCRDRKYHRQHVVLIEAAYRASRCATRFLRNTGARKNRVFYN